MEKDTARFDTRLSKEQKEYFEYAATLGGYRTLTEFIVVSAKSKADEIVEKHKSILGSARDQEIFFDAVLNPPKPGKKLIAAAKKYNRLLQQK
ncbi:MAG: DUF1778 domain-containing protein [Chitinophagaceae bacterium]|nr:MAG: DUF1778 domain-containing protein [Chitinophagaceae bacterium]